MYGLGLGPNPNPLSTPSSPYPSSTEVDDEIDIETAVFDEATYMQLQDAKTYYGAVMEA
jgi:hypothetical protein